MRRQFLRRIPALIVLAVFLGCGPSVDRQLLTAAESGDRTLVQNLLEQGAGTDARDAKGRTPLHLAVLNGHAGVVTDLLAAGADADAVDQLGWMPLHHAAVKGQTACGMLLIQAKADINAKTRTGFTPYYLALQNDNHDLASALRLAGGKSTDSLEENPDVRKLMDRNATEHQRLKPYEQAVKDYQNR